MTQYFRKVMCSEGLPNKGGKYDTHYGELTFLKEDKNNWIGDSGRWTDDSERWYFPVWWLEPVEEQLYTKADMLSCWDAALSHALKLKGYYKTFAGFIKSLKK